MISHDNGYELDHMTFILVPKRGEEVQVNAWNWRPTLHLLQVENLITEQYCVLLGANGCGGQVGAELASRIAAVIERKLLGMKPGERLLADLTITAKPKVPQIFSPDANPTDIDEIDLYSATYEWLVTFKEFCKVSGGFKVL